MVALAKPPSDRNLSSDAQPRSADDVTLEEAATILRVSDLSVMRLVAKGLLKARLEDDTPMFLRAAVVAFEQQQARLRREVLVEMCAMSEEFDF